MLRSYGGTVPPSVVPNLAVVQANDIGGKICEIHLIPGAPQGVKGCVAVTTN